MENLKKDLQNFYKRKADSDHNIYSLLFSFAEEFSHKLPITISTKSDHDSDGIDIYREVLLPKFIKFVENNDFDIFNFDKNQCKERFLTLLDKNIEEFNEYQEPIVFRNHIYFLNFHSKYLAGFPKNKKDRVSSIEDIEDEALFNKGLFNYEYCRISERNFLKIVTSYINLYKHHEKTTKINKFLGTLVIILIILVIIFIK